MAKKSVPSAPAPGTKVVALHPIDQRPPVGELRTIVFFVIRSVLDQQVLRDSLDKLIRNHLPVLGARLHTAPKEGGLDEFRYPESFPDDATLFGWSEKSIESTLDATKLIPDTSASNGSVVWGRSMEDFEAAWAPSDWSFQRKDDKPDTPLLLVHFTSYLDATVLTLNIPHCVSDQKGLASMVQAWLAVAQGSEPPPFITLEPGVLDGPDLPQSELRQKGKYRLKSKGEHIRTIVGLLPDIIRNREETGRLMFLPVSLVTRLRDRCNDELTSKHGSDHPVLTNGDVISSSLAKLAYLSRNKKTKTFVLGETVNARGRHPALPEGKHYLHNCPAYACARFKFNKDTPLSEIALKHRLSVNETAQTASIERSFAVTKKVFDGGFAFPMGEAGDLSFHVTNWSSAWHGIDFSHVRKEKSAKNATDIKNGVPEGTSRTALSMLVLGSSTQRDSSIHRLSAPILCKTDGGYWVAFTTSTKNMLLVDELLKKDPFLDTL
ncbi:unnamed protein product [Clonostachys rosea]|uniref:Uncharacterized protein n=1 Tax=Bionectria ochroleuca TaxID=29856 RepID=A0ABY6UYC2_BIOOC|nr:unnamed protein product [Clonostachys rosea]